MMRASVITRMSYVFWSVAACSTGGESHGEPVDESQESVAFGSDMTLGSCRMPPGLVPSCVEKPRLFKPCGVLECL